MSVKCAWNIHFFECLWSRWRYVLNKWAHACVISELYLAKKLFFADYTWNIRPPWTATGFIVQFVKTKRIISQLLLHFSTSENPCLSMWFVVQFSRNYISKCFTLTQFQISWTIVLRKSNFQLVKWLSWVHMCTFNSFCALLSSWSSPLLLASKDETFQNVFNIHD